MTDENQVEDQDVELHDEDEIMEAQGHDPKNAEAQSVASVDKAGDATGSAPLPTSPGATAKNNTKKDPMPKTKAALMAAVVGKMQKMDRKALTAMYHYNSTSEEDFDGEPIAETQDINYQVDFSEDLNALVESEATLSDEFKNKAETIFEAAIKSKLGEEIDRLEAKYEEELSEEIKTTKEDLIEKVDSYLNYVVENWMEENKLAVQAGLRTEIAEGFMNNLKDLFTESYIEVPESKVDLVDELSETVEELEEKLNESTGKSIEMAEELELLKRERIIMEASSDLTDTQSDKLTKLVADIDYEDDDTFIEKVVTVKESYFNKKAVSGSTDMDETDETDDLVETSGSMGAYLTAIKRQNK